jgi:hypothetical protein
VMFTKDRGDEKGETRPLSYVSAAGFEPASPRPLAGAGTLYSSGLPG